MKSYLVKKVAFGFVALTLLAGSVMAEVKPFWAPRPIEMAELTVGEIENREGDDTGLYGVRRGDTVGLTRSVRNLLSTPRSVKQELLTLTVTTRMRAIPGGTLFSFLHATSQPPHSMQRLTSM